jgi:two-component system, chemotaxis family, sensor kinase Cph1
MTQLLLAASANLAEDSAASLQGATAMTTSQQLEAMLAECAREPIRYPGKIQPHGMLLAVQRQDLNIVCASENCPEYLGVEADALLGQSLRSQLELDQGILGCLRDQADSGSGLFALPQRNLAVLIHLSEATALLELQPLRWRDAGATPLPQGAALALSAIHAAPDASAAIDAAVREVQRLLGYDRVMAYRFDREWNGQVVAERTTSGATPFLGLRYPASDIPEQARALYAQNWLRVIPDVRYAPVALRARDPGSLASLDLGDAVLRSVSPIHIEYLKNMGVGASLSISLRCDGALWGLIACHHMQPRYVSFELLERCELLGCVLSAKLESEQARERAAAGDAAKSGSDRLVAGMRTHGVAEALLRREAEVLELVQATGGALLHRGALHRFGQTPDEPQLRELIAWLSASGHAQLDCAALHEQHPPARDYARVAAGLLCVRLPDTQPAFLMWFRPELVHMVRWGGNPEKPVEADGHGPQLGPRRSFELWKQTVRLTARPWTDAERAAAAALRRGIIEADLHRQLAREQEQRRSLEASNRELDLYAHVIAHDLLAPLRGIVAFSERMQRELAEGELEQAISRARGVGRSAAALADLVRSLHQYSRAGQTGLAIEDTDLGALVALEQERLAPFLCEHGADVQVDGALPTLRCDRVRVGAVLGNLISNAVKYNLSAPKRVRIHCRATRPPTICVADNGIGIPVEERGHVFEMFRRLHNQDAFGGGSGMGLAIARRTVELHGGRIWVEETPGGGTTIAFTLAPE